MRTIHKHTLMITDAQEIATREGAVPLCVGDQNERPCLWVQVDTDAPKVDRVVYVVGTGNPMPDDDMIYVGSSVGRFVWHVYLAADWYLDEDA